MLQKALADYWRTLRVRSLPWAPYVCNLVRGKKGLEVGGPTKFFCGALPIYRAATSLDGVNFSQTTHWEGSLKQAVDGFRFYGFRRGRQFVAEATSLNEIEGESYDFVVSSNCLEHIANPLKALCEWRRVVVEEGFAVIIVPKKAHSFDRKRPITSIGHLIDDFRNGVGEDDLTHLDEILSLHDLSLDRQAGTPEEFRERCGKNQLNRFMHHHVFDMSLLKEAMRICGFKSVLDYETHSDLVTVAEKMSEVPLYAGASADSD
jgi:SAM-dependent methyltransferase